MLLTGDLGAFFFFWGEKNKEWYPLLRKPPLQEKKRCFIFIENAKRLFLICFGNYFHKIVLLFCEGDDNFPGSYFCHEVRSGTLLGDKFRILLRPGDWEIAMSDHWADAALLVTV